MEGDPIVGGSSSSAIKKGRRPSGVWKEMRKYKDTDGNDKAECKHCKKMFDGSSKKGTTHLKNHLERCPANPKRKGPGGPHDGDDQDQSLSASIKTKELANLIKEKSVSGLIRHFSSTEGDGEWDPWVLYSRKDEILQLYQEEKEKLCQFLNNLSCRFTLQLAYCDSGMGVDEQCLVVDDSCFLVAYYIDDSWERQSKIISFWPDRPDVKGLIEDVKQSCLDWKIDRNKCSVRLPFIPTDDAEGWFSQQGSLPFASFICDADSFMQYIENILDSGNYAKDLILSIQSCALYVYKKSISDKLIQLGSAVEKAISILYHFPCRHLFGYLETAVAVKEVFSALEQFDSKFRSINLSKQKWDEVTATFEHLKFLKDIADSFFLGECGIPIIVDLPYAHKILTDRCNHQIEDCLFCEKVMKEAIDRFFSKCYWVRVIAVILDPRFKMNGMRLHYKEFYGSDADRYLEKVNKDLKHVYDEYAATDSSNSKSYEMPDAMGRPSLPKSELDLYMKELKVPAVQQFDILAWWRGNAPFYPTLARMARDYLALALEVPFAYDPVEGVLDAVGRNDIKSCLHFGGEGLREIISALLCLRGFFSSA